MGKIKCFIKSCNNIYPINKNYSWHEWPSQENAIHLWITELRKNEALTGFTENSVPILKSSTRICSEHFEKTCFIEGSVRRLLKPTAVPTIFSCSSHKDSLSASAAMIQHKVHSGNLIC